MEMPIIPVLAAALVTLALFVAYRWVCSAIRCRASRQRYRALETWRFTWSGEATYRFRFIGNQSSLSCQACGSGDVQRVCSGTAHAWSRWTPFGSKHGPKFAYWSHRCANCDFELFRTREPYIEKSRLDYSQVEIRPDAHVLRMLKPRSDRAPS